MSKRYNLTVPIKLRNGDTMWHAVGSLWFDEGKNQLTMVFNSLPLPNEEGEVRVLGFPPKDGDAPRAGHQERTWPKKREEAAGRSPPATKGGRKSLREDLDDEVPF